MSQKLVLQIVVSLFLASICLLDYAQAKENSYVQFHYGKVQEPASSIMKNFLGNNDAICTNWHDDITVNTNSSRQSDEIMKKINLCNLCIPFITLTTYMGYSSGSHNSSNNDSIFESLKPLPYNAEQKLSSAPVPGVRSFGCLKPSLSNPRYFTDESEKAIYLVGSHTWFSLMDMGSMDPPEQFDYKGYLDFLQRYNHNFIRLWTWELTKYRYKNDETFRNAAPFPWQRTGAGMALDGKPKFDLGKFDQEYFDRLRSRVIAARDRGIYVSIMLFEGHGIQYSNAPWRWDGHPFNIKNNINRVDGDPDKDGKGLESHTLQIPGIVKLQEDYVKKVVDTVNDLDNVLYEISNEEHAGSIDWQYYMINFIRNYEKTKPKQHPTGMTADRGLNSYVFNSSAEWVSPSGSGTSVENDPYKINPPATDGSKVVILDTDHLWGTGGDRVWVWKSFLRGYNPIYMDDLASDATKEGARKAMGHTLAYARKMNLNDMFPRNDLASTEYCLANPGLEYLVYQPETDKSFTVDLVAGRYRYEWFDTNAGAIVLAGSFITDGDTQSFVPPFRGDAVLHIRRSDV